jgi:hypothetical protein
MPLASWGSTDALGQGRTTAVGCGNSRTSSGISRYGGKAHLFKGKQHAGIVGGMRCDLQPSTDPDSNAFRSRRDRYYSEEKPTARPALHETCLSGLADGSISRAFRLQYLYLNARHATCSPDEQTRVPMHAS